MENPNIPLEDILNVLVTDEVRMLAISKLLEKRGIHSSLVEEVIQYYEKVGRSGDAGDVAFKAGMSERAIQCYVKGERFGDAGDVASKAGMTEIANKLRYLEDLIAA